MVAYDVGDRAKVFAARVVQIKIVPQAGALEPYIVYNRLPFSIGRNRNCCRSVCTSGYGKLDTVVPGPVTNERRNASITGNNWCGVLPRYAVGGRGLSAPDDRDCNQESAA